MSEEIEQEDKKITPEMRKVFEKTFAEMMSGEKYQHDYLYWAHMIAQCKIVFEDMEAPAAVSFHTDVYWLHINPKLFNAFPLEQRLGILKHEMEHILYLHVARGQEIPNHKQWNYATDCAINQFIDRSHLPSGVIYPDNLPVRDIYKGKVPNMQASEVYYPMIDPPEDDPNEPKHDKWQESEGDPDLQKDITKGMADKSMNETQKGRGNLPSNISDILDMLSSKAELDWRKVLKGIVGNKRVGVRRTLMKPNRRFGDRPEIKGRIKDRLFDLVVVGDESGSVSSKELIEAIVEIQAICEVTKTPVWYVPVDTQAHEPQLISQNQRNFERSACGGTILAPAIDMIHDRKIKHDAVVVITDGGICESDVQAYKDLGKRVIWLITSDGYIMDSMNDGKMQVFKLQAKE